MTVAQPLELSPGRVRFALLALALGGFAIGATEFVAMGLLPNIAQAMLPGEYAVSSEGANAHAGLIVSSYALGVVVGAPTIAAFGARLPRKVLLFWLTLGFTVFTVAAAFAPSFGWLVFFRFLCGLPHGAYFGVASLVAGDLMGPGRQGRGIAFVMSGLTVSNVVGVPAITWVGQVGGWRLAYGLVAALFLATCVAVSATLPLRPGRPNQTIRRELKAFTKVQVWFCIAMGAIGFGGFFALDTYIAPLVTDVAGRPAWMVPIALVVFGIGMVIGNLIGGRTADRSVKWTIIGAFGTLALALLFTALVAHIWWALFIGIFVVGLTSQGITPGVLLRLFRVAHESQTIAGAIHHSAFNIGNSLGAYLGGVVIAAGFGYVAPVWLGIGLTLCGVVLAFISFGVEARTARRGGPPTERAEPGDAQTAAIESIQ